MSTDSNATLRRSYNSIPGLSALAVIVLLTALNTLMFWIAVECGKQVEWYESRLDELRQLHDQNNELRSVNIELRVRIDELETGNAELRAENADFWQQLADQNGGD